MDREKAPSSEYNVKTTETPALLNTLAHEYKQILQSFVESPDEGRAGGKVFDAKEREELFVNLEFEWDAAKASENLKNHRVSFEEAKSVFNDPLLLTFPDPEHSDEEHRSINIGVSSHSRILLVVFTDRKGKLRIISSRKATAKEKKLYETY